MSDLYDYDGDFSHWQKKLDIANVEYDVANLAGCTYHEIDSFVNELLALKLKDIEINVTVE